MASGDDKKKTEDSKVGDAAAEDAKSGKGAARVPRTLAKSAATSGGNGARVARAVARYVRMSPRKLRLVMDSIRGKGVKEARGILRFCGKRAAGPLSKVLESAVANAENNHSMEPATLVITTAYVDQGPSYKSFIPRARGRASAIHKFSSHITIEVKEREEV